VVTMTAKVYLRNREIKKSRLNDNQSVLK